MAGSTTSEDFPTRLPLFVYEGGGDVWLSRLVPAGNDLVYSTYLGGSGADEANAVAVDLQGNAYVAGTTASGDFPLSNPIQPAYAGGAADAFVSSIDADGRSLNYSTYLGGSGDDHLGGAAVDGEGIVWVSGYTDSPDFPVRCALQPLKSLGRDLFVATLAPEGWLVSGTYLGGSGEEFQNIYATVAADGAGFTYLAALTQSTDFPLVNPLQPVYAGSGDDAIVKLSMPGALPGPVGNTLTAVRVSAGGDILFQWADAPMAIEHHLRRDVAKDGPLARIAGTAVSGATGLLLTAPPDPSIFFRVAGANCKGEGPR